jgi:ankyrin repeat protein
VLLENGAAVDATNAEGQTPLHLSAANGHVNCIKILLERGANPLAKDASASTVLHAAACG